MVSSHYFYLMIIYLNTLIWFQVTYNNNENNKNSNNNNSKQNHIAEILSKG